MREVDPRIEDAARRALEEDIGTGDITTDSTVPADHLSHARIIAKEAGVLAGVEVAKLVFRTLDPGIEFDVLVGDGTRLTPGASIATVRGRTRAILTGERTALNFLQRLSGIATLTAECAALVGESSTRILDTRKTTPGLRRLEKYAVRMGGGGNHRMGLWDAALIKDNHIAAAGSIADAVARVRAKRPDIAIEVEVTGRRELDEALDAGVERIMLDNMTTDEMKRAVRRASEFDPRPEIEISGGVTPGRLAELASVGADFISIGALTHSAPALDISLEMEG